MALTATKVSAEDYLAFPAERRTELIDGEVVVNEPLLPHQRVIHRIMAELDDWEGAGAGRGEVGLPVDVRIDDGNVFAPDLWWVAEDRRPAPDAEGLDGLPDLAVEVRSPSTWRYDVGPKKDSYQRAGLTELWLVDTASRSVLVYRRSTPGAHDFDVSLELSGDDVLASPLLPGFAVSVADLF